MTLTINGESRQFEAEAFTVSSLLEALGLAGKPLVVELNREAIFPDDYSEAQVKDGSSLEIVTIAAGG